MKNSVILVSFQVLSLILSFFTTFYLATSLDSKAYAVISVFQLLQILVLSFSVNGIDTYNTRELLKHKHDLNNLEITHLLYASVITRGILSIFVQLPVLLFCYCISVSKFNGDYLFEFFVVSLTSIFVAVNDTVSLFLRSMNKFVIVSVIRFILDVVGKIISLFIFIEFGLREYLIFISLLPILATFVLMFSVKCYITLPLTFDFKKYFYIFSESRSFLYQNYLNFGVNYLDQLLVSMFLSAEFIGVYGISKQILQFGKQFIDNVFDPLIQKLIYFYNSQKDKVLIVRRINKIKFYLLSLSLVFLILFIFYAYQIIHLIKLQNYPDIFSYLLGTILSCIIYLFGKDLFYYIQLFCNPSTILRYTFILCLCTLILSIFILSFVQLMIPYLSLIAVLWKFIYSCKYIKIIKYEIYN